MIFRRISHRIALQFTAFVFLMFMINGMVFLVADFGNARRQLLFRLDQSLDFILQQQDRPLPGRMMGMPVFDVPPRGIPSHMRERIRILDAQGRAVYSGGLYQDAPFVPEEGYSEMEIQDEEYRVLTTAIRQNGQIIGFAQIADIERQPLSGLPPRVFLYLLVSLMVTALTYVVGIFFARRSLKPAQEMMERLEQFTQDASHELRTPLAALNSSLDLALKTKKYREGIADAKEDVKQITRLVERLLELARLDSFVLENVPVDLSELTANAAEKLKPIARTKKISIETDIVPGVTVSGDPALIRQVLGNLLSNAIKFSKPAGGTVRVHLTHDELSVEDNGIGIAKNALANVFNRFFQADMSRANEGLGLGLALAKRIVELHGWTIAAKSTKGKGTTFTVRFAS